MVNMNDNADLHSRMTVAAAAVVPGGDARPSRSSISRGRKSMSHMKVTVVEPFGFG